jgi:hypothetical protein
MGAPGVRCLRLTALRNPFALRVIQSDTFGSLGHPAIVHGVTDQHVLIAFDLTEDGNYGVMTRP